MNSVSQEGRKKNPTLYLSLKESKEYFARYKINAGLFCLSQDSF
jgi:hypothetical protein